MNRHRPLPIMGALLLLLVGLLLGFHRQSQHPKGNSFLLPAPTLSAMSQEPFFQGHFVSDSVTRLVHAGTVVQRQDGVLQAFWFGGTREGHGDVNIYTATLAPLGNGWSRDAALVTREATQAGECRHVKKLGNPVAARDLDGRLWLFYVSVSVGGWSGSSINLMISDDHGQTWSRPRQLITSPFFNLSTLVKGPPILYADGAMGLPVYHEFLGKFAEFLRLDSRGRVVGKSRISWGRQAIQPVVIPLDDKNALALMRNTDSSPPRRAWVSRTSDGGTTWTVLERTTIFNKDSSIAGLHWAGLTLCAANFSERDRSSLSLLLSRDQGRTWFFIHDVEPLRPPLAPEHFIREVAKHAPPAWLPSHLIANAAAETQCEPGRPLCGYRFDYPYLYMDDSATFHLLYTWNRAFIRHVSFNAAWLDRQTEYPLEVLITREAQR